MMKIIIVSIPLFVSLIAFYFYFLVKPVDKILRFIPYILISIILEDFYWLYVYTNISQVVSDNVGTPPFPILTMLFIFLFLYELLGRKIISRYRLMAHFSPITFLLVLYLINRAWVIDSKSYYWVTYISGVTLGLVYLIIISLKIRENKRLTYKIHGAFELIALPIVIIVLVSISVGMTIFLGTFINLTFYLFKVIELITIIALYFYLFSLYKEKLEIQGEKRLKSFETLYNIPQVIIKKDVIMSIDKSKNDIEKHFAEPAISKYQKSRLNSRKIKEYENIITHFFKQEKEEYLDVDFNKQRLSLLTGIPGYYLSQVFHIALNTNFNTYLSKKRIEFACKLLEDSENRISATELSFLCGYKSRTSFYEQFEKVTGYSLSEYKIINGL